MAAGLRWSEPLGGAILASQLLNLGRMHRKVTDDSFARFLAGIVPQMYRVLSELSEDDFEVARAALHGSECIWVGNGFAPAGLVALKVGSEGHE